MKKEENIISAQKYQLKEEEFIQESHCPRIEDRREKRSLLYDNYNLFEYTLKRLKIINLIQ